ncbi:MAG: hypothetical protein HON94_04760 [Methylococcales bacterium]|nr:hypothetical protein [Methylococcales bacterium]MBT7410151.1 hypothetical protein [Methylococcales bacterium]
MPTKQQKAVNEFLAVQSYQDNEKNYSVISGELNSATSIKHVNEASTLLKLAQNGLKDLNRIAQQRLLDFDKKPAGSTEKQLDDTDESIRKLDKFTKVYSRTAS